MERLVNAIRSVARNHHGLHPARRRLSQEGRSFPVNEGGMLTRQGGGGEKLGPGTEFHFPGSLPLASTASLNSLTSWKCFVLTTCRAAVSGPPGDEASATVWEGPSPVCGGPHCTQ